MIVLVFVLYAFEQPLNPLILPPIVFEGVRALEECRYIEDKTKRQYEHDKTIRHYFSSCEEGIKRP